eukprot:scaffold14778_cov109-Isochrysis_galbana.AAC.8
MMQQYISRPSSPPTHAPPPPPLALLPPPSRRPKLAAPHTYSLPTPPLRTSPSSPDYPPPSPPIPAGARGRLLGQAQDITACAGHGPVSLLRQPGDARAGVSKLMRRAHISYFIYPAGHGPRPSILTDGGGRASHAAGVTLGRLKG